MGMGMGQRRAPLACKLLCCRAADRRHITPASVAWTVAACPCSFPSRMDNYSRLGPYSSCQLARRAEQRYRMQQSQLVGVQVVLAANSLPAINDITCDELRTLISSAAALDPVIHVRNFYGFYHLCSIYTVLLSPGLRRPSELHDWLPRISQLLTHVFPTPHPRTCQNTNFSPLMQPHTILATIPSVPVL